MAPQEYADWVVAADPKAIMEGAEMGAKMSQEMEAATRNQGLAAGATLGLLRSYSTETDHTEFRETVDGDLYKRYLEELANNDIEIPD